MLLHGIRRRLSALLTGLLLIIAGMVMATVPAQAQGRNLVIFGDSVIADTPPLEHVQVTLSNSSSGSSTSSGSSGSSSDTSSTSSGSSATPAAGGCATSDSSFAAQTAQQLNLEPRDYSCSGATSFTPAESQFADQVDLALADDALTPATERVLVTIGFNDTYNNIHLSAGEIRSNFVAAMAPHVEKIKAAAPNARVQIVGYANIADGDFVCLAHVGGNIHDRTYLPVIGYWEQLAQDMQRDLAQATGMEFVDLKPATADNGMCAPDDRRMWAGIIDFHAGQGNLPIHLNARGHQHVADVLAAS